MTLGRPTGPEEFRHLDDARDVEEMAIHLDVADRVTAAEGVPVAGERIRVQLPTGGAAVAG
ncbi:MULTISPECIES: hypothetical protein [unclassified Micromonospora]|uniref:hypothetical protein n=1 Tax=unclassified Micromonospora TaxID=2617518 RepID=UPI0033B9DC7A